MTDTDGNPVADVSIQVKGTNKLTATNSKGEYAIVMLDTDILLFTSVSYTSHEAGIKQAGSVIMALQNKGLDEVVVVGYGIIGPQYKN